ncbi:MAG TPA: hypothetical protein VHE53_01960 [Patescibacteria group bacterium]|nr:hypothetical protein [Patescibacteria group bacterium]
MEDLGNKLGWQKVAVIGIVIAILFILFVVFSFIYDGQEASKNSKQNQNKNTNNSALLDNGNNNQSNNGGNPNANNNNPTSTPNGQNIIIPTIPVTPGVAPFSSTILVLTPYDKSKNYTISYPSSWETKNQAVVGGGNLTHFTYPAANGSEDFPRVDIQVTPITSSTVSIQDMINNLSSAGLNHDTVNFHGVNVDRLTGVLPFTFKTNTGQELKANKTFLIFDNNGYRYLIDYAYYLDGNQANSLEAINKTLDTLKFK